MKQNFVDATKVLEIISANKQLTNDNYSKVSADDLAQNVWNTIQSYVQANLGLYQNLPKQNYEQRKKFVSDILNMLLDKFDGNNKDRPKIYFKEEITNLWPKSIPQPSACCYSPNLSPWAEQYFKATTLNASEPFFAFFHDLTENGMLGQITHEFTHYLQSIGHSSLSRDVVNQASEYYQYYYMDKNKYKQIYKDSIHEVEANNVGDFVNMQVRQMIKISDMTLNQQNHFSK